MTLVLSPSAGQSCCPLHPFQLVAITRFLICSLLVSEGQRGEFPVVVSSISPCYDFYDKSHPITQ